jgi:hypothetical protein
MATRIDTLEREVVFVEDAHTGLVSGKPSGETPICNGPYLD